MLSADNPLYPEVLGCVLGTVDNGGPMELPSENVPARMLLADPEAVSVLITYDDGSQIVFRRATVIGD